MQNAILLIRCPDQKGLIARITGEVARLQGNIVAADQHTTAPEGGEFLMRLEFRFDPAVTQPAALEAALAALASQLGAAHQVHYPTTRLRAGILVSRQTHCLADLLHRVQTGDLDMDVAVVVGNHPQGEALAGHYGVPFYRVDVSARDKGEAAILERVKGTDFLVLARYMQILSAGFLEAYGRDIINIHHSFLPGFKGANPYQQAWDRGVKVIGATAHFVTRDLDEGPIIEQRVQRVSHRDMPEDLKRKGRDLEQQALAWALDAYTQRRVFRHGLRTVVFD